MEDRHDEPPDNQEEGSWPGNIGQDGADARRPPVVRGRRRDRGRLRGGAGMGAMAIR